MTEDTQKKLFSAQRLKGYASPKEHEANFTLIASISHKIGILEVVIRNKIDSILLEKKGDWWQHLPQNIHITGDPTCKEDLVSKQSMGFWLKVVECFKIYDKLFDLDFLDRLNFKRYCSQNKNRFGNKTSLKPCKKAHLKRYEKADLILQLLHALRNRAFHFENLYKYTPKGYPRLSVKITDDKHRNKNQAPQLEKPQELYVALQPDKIQLFLDDLLESFNPGLVNYAK
ncbi:hypothetical protein [Helicobacter ailurogastricus]|uniref:hypothetical protein n=1 Tax=Helicobacter ailurogastricus TaxID=1578720 RepID=UPI000CF05A78|nr:hypothetical protein [Helicobacter ailurogastricus]